MSWGGGEGRLYLSTFQQRRLGPVAEEQFVLKRVADCAIDLYAMVVVLSRYGGVSRSYGAC